MCRIPAGRLGRTKESGHVIPLRQIPLRVDGPGTVLGSSTAEFYRTLAPLFRDEEFLSTVSKYRVYARLLCLLAAARDFFRIHWLD